MMIHKRTHLTSDFAMRDTVIVDGDTSLKGHVTGFMWGNGDSLSIEVSWIHNGASYTVWMMPWRLTRVS